MSNKARVVVLEVVSGHLTVTQAARVYGLSRQHRYRLLNRDRHGGLETPTATTGATKQKTPAAARGICNQ
jgi:transposase